MAGTGTTSMMVADAEDKIAAAAARLDAMCGRLDAMERDDACARVAERADASPWDKPAGKPYGVEYRPGAAQSLRTEWFSSEAEAQQVAKKYAKNGLQDVKAVRKDAASRADGNYPSDRSNSTGAYNKEAVSQAIASAYRGQKAPSAKKQAVTHALLKGWRGDSVRADATPATAMPGKRTNKEYEVQGWNAKEAGYKESDCPYYASSTAEKYWKKGFRG